MLSASVAFAAAIIAVAIAASDQATQTGTRGVGLAVSGAVVTLPATAYFGYWSARALLRHRPFPTQFARVWV